MDDDERHYWYDLSSGRVDEGHQKGAKNLMGPYGSRAEAERALATARERTEAWDAADED